MVKVFDQSLIPGKYMQIYGTHYGRHKENMTISLGKKTLVGTFFFGDRFWRTTRVQDHGGPR